MRESSDVVTLVAELGAFSDRYLIEDHCLLRWFLLMRNSFRNQSLVKGRILFT